MKKKALFVAAIAVCILGLISAGTMAWFNSRDSISSDFHVATSEDHSPEDIFSVDVYEMVNSQKEQVGQVYQGVLPGSVLAKAPVVENTGRYSQWVRVKVTFSDARAWLSLMAEGVDLRSMLNMSSDWTYSSAVENTANNKVTYVFYLNRALDVDETVATFTTVTIPTALTKELAYSIGSFTVDVVAEALQYDNLNSDTLNTAKKAFESVGWMDNMDGIG